MAKKLDQIIVVDVEATCWDGEPPPGQESEIIEIGVCTLDVASCQRLEKQDILVKPERSTVSAYCTRLTTLSQAEIDRGIAFAEACAILQKQYLSKNRVWASYGDYDRRQFAQQCQSHNLEYPFGPTHINVKNLFALAHGLREEVGMAKALELMHLPLEGVHHRAGDDVWNIARILSELLLKLRGGKSS
ncbi:MAG: exonuclease domain-containing protein [candidate division KSB1 bacterium]|nr:exonuclease domain-containing protein [candidate division KSB1 bacterium]MDZ7303781.1 exonuclease domain-containing protein [candidate division KSB1 bacterium]MDZ7313040.1 exonuclease domain-containing protein [candidate division KSB1 bacterium]